jgi:glycosyltransferase involved in cell wall biosynthesis
MQTESVSVILPTYNRAHLLNRSIASVLSQLEGTDELIVVDDGSTDNTEHLIKKYGNRVRYIKIENQGAGVARNCGVKEAKNPLIAFIDSDDEWLPGKIKLQRAFMSARADLVFCFTNFAFKEAKELGGREKHFNLISWTKDYRNWEEVLGPKQQLSSVKNVPSEFSELHFYEGNLYVLQLKASYVNVNTLMVRRHLAGDALYFAEDTKTYEDWECIGHLSRLGTCVYLDCETACQHSHGGERLTDAHTTVCAEARVKILPRVWGTNKEFLMKNRELYQRILDSERLKLIDGLLVRGETEKARFELRQIKDRRLFLRNLLSILPGSITKYLLSLRRSLKPASKTQGELKN